MNQKINGQKIILLKNKWTEDYTIEKLERFEIGNNESPEQLCKNMINYFNGTRNEMEEEREFLGIEELKETIEE